MSEVFDLFGDPVPEGWGRRGRPQHIATLENRNKVKMLLALGWNNERIARAIGITPPTLRRNYFRELKVREEMRDRLDASIAMRIWKQVETGNVGAIREFSKFVEKNDLMNFGRSPRQPERQPAAQKLGKKETAAVAAHQPDTGSALGRLIAARQGGGVN